MIPELGHFALVLALVLALLQSSLPLLGAARGDARLMAVGGPSAVGQLALVAFAFACLIRSYVVSDFSVLNVVQNSHSLKPLLYKLSGAWGNHEGSMVLWVLILSIFGAAVALFGRNLPTTLRARVLSVQGMIGLGFLAFILATSNPFTRIDPPPLDGNDLNPLLQDPGLAFHPPFLYFGYVGFSMAFAFAVAALIEGKVDAAWARWVRPWTLAAWCGLTIGIALGSWWAYYELGWGGWWFWDPVENASFMPWLAGTALLHSAIVVEKRDTLKSWTILLAIIAFGLSLVGTFLVRSGVLTSVHAFAVDPRRGIFILALLAITLGGALTLYAWRAPTLKAGGLFAPISREGALILNNLLLATACAVVFVGTLAPLFYDAFGYKISIGRPFFEQTFVPLAIAVVAVMGIGPMLAWKRGDLAGALGRLKLAGALTIAVVLFTLYLRGTGPVMALLGVALAAWAILSALAELADRTRLFDFHLGASLRRARHMPASAWGMIIAHAGIGVAVAGMTASTAWMSERIERMAFGQAIEIAGYSVTLDSVAEFSGPNYSGYRGHMTVVEGGETIGVLEPEKRWYPVAGMPTTEAAIRTTFVSDLYAALGDPQDDGSWVVRIYHHPLVPWIWGGAIIMAIGGLFSLSDRRLRVGAPAKRARLVVQPAE